MAFASHVRRQYNADEWEFPPTEGRIAARVARVRLWQDDLWPRRAQPEGAADRVPCRAPRDAGGGQAGKKLLVNLVLIAEGEEEIASPDFAEIVATPRVTEAFKNCVGVIMPTAAQGSGGGVSLLLGAKVDIHSSKKVGLDSPVWQLVAALSTLVTPDGNTGRSRAFASISSRSPNGRRQCCCPRRTKRAPASVPWANILWHRSVDRRSRHPGFDVEADAGADAQHPGGSGRRLYRAGRQDDPAQQGDGKVRVPAGARPGQTDENSALVRAELATLKRYGIKNALVPRIAGKLAGGGE